MVYHKKRINLTQIERQRLYDEVGGLCPLCGANLTIKNDGKLMNVGEYAHIYPHSPTSSQLEALKGLPQSQDSESIENIILLCRNCHKKQDYHTTPEEYLTLYNKKLELANRQKVKEELSYVNINEEISEVLRRLFEIGVVNSNDLLMEIVPIKNKISDDVLLQNKVMANVTQYYGTIRSSFQDMDRHQSGTFQAIASSIKHAYCTTIKGDLVKDKERVFNSLVNWLCSKTNGRHSACEIVISFFVQNCEVFDAVAQ